MGNIKLFQSNQIRSLWNEKKQQWYFSIVDVVGALSESLDASAYWRKTKQRLKAEGNETVTNCHRLKLMAADGKMRLTDVANTEDILRIIQSIPSPKAEPFKQWLAQVGSDRKSWRKNCGGCSQSVRSKNRPQSCFFIKL